MFRILKTGGVCGTTAWDSVGWVTYIREAVHHPWRSPFPDHETYITSFGDGKPWHHAAYVKQKLEDHGFQGIEVNVVPNFTPIENATAFVEQFSGILEHLTTDFWSQEDRASLVRKSNRR
jgi:hypothetical protein